MEHTEIRNGEAAAAPPVLPGGRAYARPIQMNLELTTRCPLHCPQCYVSLNTGREMPLKTALYWIRQGAEYGVQSVNLSGGETLCYPYLNELIRECARHSMSSAVALSGAYVTEDTLRGMIDAGVGQIFVSLNGSTEEINARTRDGYALAIHALELLQKLDFPERWVNWVMHASNASDLPDMLALCERYGMKGLVVLAFKPDSSHAFRSFPTAEQLRQAAKTLKNYKGPLAVGVESCFSQLRCLRYSGFLGCLNLGIPRGCGAGRDGVSVNVDGLLTPCRHLDAAERVSTLAEYWEHSPFLARLREAEDHREPPCRGCTYERNCLPCMAVGVKLHGRLNYGMAECPLGSDS
ncbi:MAG: radical SAM protein [Oscillibacter sp.]|nr:radical SAM protein [Oscillibacter sp.]